MTLTANIFLFLMFFVFGARLPPILLFSRLRTHPAYLTDKLLTITQLLSCIRHSSGTFCCVISFSVCFRIFLRFCLAEQVTGAFHFIEIQNKTHSHSVFVLNKKKQHRFGATVRSPNRHKKNSANFCDIRFSTKRASRSVVSFVVG